MNVPVPGRPAVSPPAACMVDALELIDPIGLYGAAVTQPAMPLIRICDQSARGELLGDAFPKVEIFRDDYARFFSL
jgi:hypothetical protein